MSVIIDGTNGITTPGVVNSAAETIATTLTVTGAATAASLQVGGVATNLYPLVSGTAVTASGTSVNFTGIPATAKRITVLLSAISTSGTSPMIIRLGASGGIENTGYIGFSKRFATSALATPAQLTTASYLTTTAAASSTFQGTAVVTNLSGNEWIFNTAVGSSTDDAHYTTGSKTLASVLTQVSITTVNGTDTFDAGSINIMWE
jgi:hypothetical protein